METPADCWESKRNIMKKLAPVLVLTSSILWGSMGIVTRYVASFGFTTAQTAAVRICSAAVVLVLLVLFTDKRKFKIQAGDVKWLLGTGSEASSSTT